MTCNYYRAITSLLLDRIPNFRLLSDEFFLIMNIESLYHLITLERHFTNSHRALRPYISLDRSSACDAQSVTQIICELVYAMLHEGMGLSKEAQIMRYKFTLLPHPPPHRHSEIYLHVSLAFIGT